MFRKQTNISFQTHPFAIRDPMRPEGWFIPTIVPFSIVPSSLPAGLPIVSSLSILLLLIESKFLASLTHLPFIFGLNLGDETGVIGTLPIPPLTAIFEFFRAIFSCFSLSFSSFSAQSLRNFDIFLNVEMSSPRASSIPSMRYSA
jgi:hypothetical protein